MKETIPTGRLIFYSMILGLVPIVIVLVNFFSKLNDVKFIDQRIEVIENQILLLNQKQATNIALIQSFQDADHFYIDKQLETIQLLESEIEYLQKALSNKNIAEDEAIKKRYDQLIGNENSFNFSEGVVLSSPVMQEVMESLIHPVEVDINNIKEILAKIEGVEIGGYTPGPNRPQLIITDFKLGKKYSIDSNEVFQLDLKLLKREFL